MSRIKILGLDLGTASVGWSLIEWDELVQDGQILGMGSRLFQEGVTKDSKKSYPPNQIRRTKRLARRTLRRRKLRRKFLGKILHEMGLLPTFSHDKHSDWHKVMEITTERNPYILRKKAVEEQLTPDELGRVLYHLGKRRGFLGRPDVTEDTDTPKSAAPKKPSPKKKNEDKTETDIKAEIEGLKEKMGDQTLGAYLATLPNTQDQERIRNRHTERDMFEDEFKKIWQKQKQFYPNILTDENHSRIRHALFWQRPVFWRLNTLGKCRLCPEEPLAPVRSWHTQQWRMLEQINKLRLVGGNNRPIDNQERAIILKLAQKQSSVTFNNIRTALTQLWTEQGIDLKSEFNLEATEKSIKGNAVEAKLIKIFGEKEWDTHPQKDIIRATLHEKLFKADYDNESQPDRINIHFHKERRDNRKNLITKFMTEWGLTQDQATKLSEINLPGGYLRQSTKAIMAMLPQMEPEENWVNVGDLLNGNEWHEWREEVFPNRIKPTGEIRDTLPSNPEEIGDLRNPTVNRTLTEVRKVVNNIIRKWGKPDLIRVEMARDLQKNQKEKDKIKTENKAQKDARDFAQKALEQFQIHTPSNDQKEKFLLWEELAISSYEHKAAAQEKKKKKNQEPAEQSLTLPPKKDSKKAEAIKTYIHWIEQNARCPYTGKSIGFDDLFRRAAFNVEHIWPRWRSLDNSFGNKTISCADFNRKKGNNIPMEHFQDDTERGAFKSRAISCYGTNHRKLKKFFAESILDPEGDEFSQRALNNTAYAARVVRDFLTKLYPNDGTERQYVQVTNGRVTSQLCYRWDLYTLLDGNKKSKNRADLRHHAIDALAVALTTPAFIQKLSVYYRDKDTQPNRTVFLPKPWKTLTDDAKKHVNQMIVSYRVRRKLSGALHDEMPYHRIDTSDGVKYAKKYPLESIKCADLNDIPKDRKFIKDAIIAAVGTQPPEQPAKNAPKADKDAYKADAKSYTEKIKKIADAVYVGPPEAPIPVQKVRLHITQDDNVVTRINKRQNAYAAIGGRHHMGIYQKPDGTVWCRSFSYMEAIEHQKKYKKPVRDNWDDDPEHKGSRLICSLTANSMLQKTMPDETIKYYVVDFVKENKAVVIYPHNQKSNKDMKTSFTGHNILAEKFKKISVDPIGVIKDAND